MNKKREIYPYTRYYDSTYRQNNMYEFYEIYTV